MRITKYISTQTLRNMKLEPTDKEYPIQFISKKLTKTQQRWSVPEKEASAIYHSFMKLQYLIRDKPFVLHKLIWSVCNTNGLSRMKYCSFMKA